MGEQARELRIRWKGEKVDRASWIVHREGFSIEFHVAQDPTPDKMIGSARSLTGIGLVDVYPAGVEVHRRAPADYQDGEADHGCCAVLGAPCWHDGSSLAASEFFEAWRGDDESAFRLCERWADSEEDRTPTPEATQ